MTAENAALVAEDGSVTRVKVDADLDAAGVEMLIEELLACRAAMAPRRFPMMFRGGRILLGDGVHRQVQADGRGLVAIHHPGIGWVGAAEASE